MFKLLAVASCENPQVRMLAGRTAERVVCVGFLLPATSRLASVDSAQGAKASVRDSARGALSGKRGD